jgi:hypothetical protein
MLRDPHVALAAAARIVGVRAAGWTVTPSTKRTPLAERYAETVRRVLGLDGEAGMMRRKWDAVVDDATWAVYYGAAVLEVVWGYDIATGLSHPLDLEPRILSSIDMWGDDAETLGPITQRVQGYGRTPEPMPGRKVVVVSMGRQGNDWAGMGLARAMWEPWTRLHQTQAARMEGMGRLGLLPPTVTYDATRLGGDESTQARLVQEAVDRAAQAYRGERVVVVNMTVDGAAAITTDFALDGYDPGPALAAEAADATAILESAGVGTLAMGVHAGPSGNRALGQVHEGMLRAFAVRDADTVAQAFNGDWRDGGGLVGAIIRMNHLDVDPGAFPSIAHTGMEADAFGEVLPLAQQLVDSGLIVPDATMRDRIRALLDVPALDPEQEGEAWAEYVLRKQDVTPGGGMFAAARRRAASHG